MNQKGLEQLITAVEEAEVFNMNFDETCLGGLAEEILDLENTSAGESLVELLKIKHTQAYDLYWGRDLEGNKLTGWNPHEDRDDCGSPIDRPDHREKVLNYLKSLRE